MLRIDRAQLQAPACVIDIELTAVRDDSDSVFVKAYRSVWCLSRVNGVPRDISFWDVAADTAVSLSELRNQVCMAISPNAAPRTDLPAVAASGPDITVVICTRDRPDGLRATLNSLRHQTDTDFGVLVVDNGSYPSASTQISEQLSPPGWQYVIEPRPGLSRARNRGLEEICTEVVAWMDDDEIADRNWIRRLKEGFAHESDPAAVCGLMLPVELEFEAQVRFEQYGGFNKGRGLEPEVMLAGTPSVVSPLYPLPTFGPGGNMAFRTELLRAAGGFDPYLGAGTRTHGGEEMRAFSALLSAGYAVLHWPPAVTWHTHRKEMSALRKQFYGYGAGTSAFYMSIIRAKPSTIFEILRLMPHAVRDVRGGSGSIRTGHLPDDFPSDLLKAGRRGLLEGGPMYMYEALRGRRSHSVSAPLVRKEVADASRP